MRIMKYIPYFLALFIHAMFKVFSKCVNSKEKIEKNNIKILDIFE